MGVKLLQNKLNKGEVEIYRFIDNKLLFVGHFEMAMRLINKNSWYIIKDN